MMTRRMALLNSFAAIGSHTLRRPASAAPSRAMRLLDTDNDGTVDLKKPRRRPPRCSISSTVTMMALSIDAS